MSEALLILENAITDCGHWRWWTRGETTFQIEFGWVNVFIPSDDSTRPPSNTIALRFNNPRCIVALTEVRSELPDDWFARLNRDEIEALRVSHEEFTLTSLETLDSIVQSAERRDFIHGNDQVLKEIGKNDAIVAFMARGAGLIVVSESMEVFSHQGRIEIEEIPAKCAEWWKYWREYWNKIDSDKPFPKDSLCEITIPAAPE